MIYIQKSQPAPECLAQQKDYKCGDVIPRLKADFHNKCYLCEDKGITSINVEHFIPHRGDKNLMYDWNNLFYSCGHCNNTKLAIPKFNNILNCTDNTYKIAECLSFEIENHQLKSKAKITAILKEEIAENTAELLNKIYNGNHTNIKTIECENLTEKLIAEINGFEQLLLRFYQNGKTDKDKQKVVLNLAPSSPFTAFKHKIIRQNPLFMQDFICELD